MELHVELLLRSSSLDEQTTLLDGISGPILGFHAQQAVEKLLKALLSQRGLKYPRTHDLEKLVLQLLQAGESLPATPLPLKELNSYAVQFRYENPLLVPSPDRDKATTTVRIIREFVHRRVQELDQSP
jgi:HEPN domain-containing protein